MFRATRVWLDLEALRNNLQLLKRWNGADFFCPMVKANAYGHGAGTVARVVQEVGASALGVSLVEEGLALRAGGLEMPILVFAPFDVAAVSAMLTHQLTPVVTRFEDLEAISSLKCKSPIHVHLKFNTGMCRLGFDEADLARLRAWIGQHPQIHVAGGCTHFTHGDEPERMDGPSQQQLQKLRWMHEGFGGALHAHKSSSLASYALLGLAKPAGIGARPGISVYGLPHEGALTGPGLRPVLNWATRLTHTHRIRKGETVSYGARWRAERDSIIGVLPVGYGDGLMRTLSGKLHMLFRGQRVPAVGSVCMDYTMVDLTEAIQEGAPQLGEEVVLIGRQGSREIGVLELAQAAGTIPYEVVAGIRSRVAREVQ